jgi:hypothetical protein
MSIGEWIDKNDKRIRFVAWAAVGIWAVIATIVANVPPDTYNTSTQKIFPPQVASPMELSCSGHELAESWSIVSSNPAEAEIYTSSQTPIMKGNVRVGYQMGC